MRYMVVERFTQGPGPVYERFAERGRMAPPGLEFVESWVDESLDRCFQVMETDDPGLFDTWTAAWSDLTTFEIVPVITSRRGRAEDVRAALKRTPPRTDHTTCEVAAPTSCSVRPCRDHAGGVRLHGRRLYERPSGDGRPSDRARLHDPPPAPDRRRRRAASSSTTTGPDMHELIVVRTPGGPPTAQV